MAGVKALKLLFSMRVGVHCKVTAAAVSDLVVKRRIAVADQVAPVQQQFAAELVDQLLAAAGH